jgi:hypothetical protein
MNYSRRWWKYSSKERNAVEISIQEYCPNSPDGRIGDQLIPIGSSAALRSVHVGPTSAEITIDKVRMCPIRCYYRVLSTYLVQQVSCKYNKTFAYDVWAFIKQLRLTNTGSRRDR